MMVSENEGLLSSAAIVCVEVARYKHPILYATRSPPLQTGDSGWQFLCGAVHQDSTGAQVWSVGEVVELDPSLSESVFLPEGTILERESIGAPWVIRNVGK
jgi:hypothetical protein